MHIRMFVAPFLFFIFLCSQIVVLPRQVSADWCGCGYCWMEYVYGTCSCGYPYPYCFTDDVNPLQVGISSDKPRADLRAVSEDLTFAIAHKDFSEGVKTLINGRNCLHKKVTLNLLRNVSDTLKFVPARFEEKI